MLILIDYESSRQFDIWLYDTNGGQPDTKEQKKAATAPCTSNTLFSNMSKFTISPFSQKHTQLLIFFTRSIKKAESFRGI
ncbi:unnamed protein product [Albugo candida]|uniref:Uncharacterized protein n=1 Tax=Albugo candida TaxID=65357 RepID=A0A024GW00_9STRA|nr:unnamed protein product [Albugo candida]|eukprot:CCI50782.1 unnamed protein product [Albugo candida]